VNGDGFGLGWYSESLRKSGRNLNAESSTSEKDQDDDEDDMSPCIFTSVTPVSDTLIL